MKIAVIRIGYVGLSNVLLLAQNNEVIALYMDKQKIELFNKKISSIEG